ncbi:MAG: amidoligase family protein [Gammaproteobacteria bacterium]|nr:amidoligase family protein [Gammaproteobacteria bacterium]
MTRYLKAYALLQPWLLRAHGIDSSRRLSPYVDLYKRRYLDLVIDYDSPSVEGLIDDYLEHNPTRNRALDMLPMFSEVDQDRVRAAVDDARIKPRPTFHYRMPNCDIGNPEWSLISEWNRWCIVELLAHSEELESIAEEYRNWRRDDLFPTDGRWLEIVDRWVNRTIE